MSKIAVIAGQGALPQLLVDVLRDQGKAFLVAELETFPSSLSADDVVRFRVERLVPFLDHLADVGVTEVCFAGAVGRPVLEPEMFDGRTATLVPRFLAALKAGDDGALRIILSIFEEFGFAVVGAHEIAPNLLPPEGTLTLSAPGPGHALDALAGEAIIEQMGRTDSGQACIIAGGNVIAKEGPAGTDAMLRALRGSDIGASSVAAAGGILFKAPKPGQERRIDLPVIGPETALLAAEAGLAGIVIEAGGVMLLQPEKARRILDAGKLFLWVRPHGYRQ